MPVVAAQIGEAVYVGLITLFAVVLGSLRVLDRRRGTDTLLLRVILTGIVMTTAGLGGLVLGALTVFDQRLVLGIGLLASSPIVLIIGALNLLFGLTVLAGRLRKQGPA